MRPRLKDLYENEVKPKLKDQLGRANVMETPKIEKIVVNMGVGDASKDARMLESAEKELAQITGQKPKICQARRSISNFKLREGMKIGAMVTLRGDRMYEFMDRLFNVVLPRVRDFRGTSGKAFDKFGNYTLGVKEQTVFPEIDLEKVARIRGMNITFVIANSKGAKESRELLTLMGMPFVKN